MKKQDKNSARRKKQEKSLRGPEKAAILLSLLPEEVTVNIFKHLKEHEIEKLIKQILTIEPPSKDTAKKL
ncbi:hypothetical protein [Persephonella sp. KM09-Lau-8]|uniref:magnesium and cobalt transport protein CorA n=1 Tax=Persephonella sp. KM09-Lau-8 TaxID=1158345 RepID=UPI001E44A74D|nr:hypothetical protein [Persephonella sp. KM09-Lau-8]